MSDQPIISDQILFPLEEFDRAVADSIVKLPPQAKWAAVNAVRHLNRAWKLRDVDHSMAAFRAITAEEEAAAAIFRSLKRRRYEHAARLKDDNHVHKHAVIPFVQALSHMFADVPELPEMQLWIDPKTDVPQIRIRFRTKHPQTGAVVWAYPKPPLHFESVLQNTETKEEVDHFAFGIRALLDSTNAKDLLTFVRERIKRRNMLLYSTEQGYYDVKIDFVAMFEEYRSNTFLLLRALLMIDPYKQQQTFVQEALNAFLAHLKVFPPDAQATA